MIDIGNPIPSTSTSLPPTQYKEPIIEDANTTNDLLAGWLGGAGESYLHYPTHSLPLRIFIFFDFLFESVPRRDEEMSSESRRTLLIVSSTSYTVGILVSNPYVPFSSSSNFDR